MKSTWILSIIAVSTVWSSAAVHAAVTTRTYTLDQPDASSPVQILNGLSAVATFIWDDTTPTLLTIELSNTSTGVPGGFDSADQILTGISFDFGHPGYNGDAQILSGSVTLGPAATHFNMDTPVGPGANLSGEWGFGNMDGTGLLPNLVSANTAGVTPFGGPNLDGPTNIDGPQGGIVANPPWVAMGGVGAVADMVSINLTLDTPLTDLDFLDENGVRAEFGSDAAFLTPEPASLVLLALGMMALSRRRA